MGNSQVAFDAVCATIIGLDPRSVDHIRLAEDYGFGTTDLAKIAITGDVSLDEAKARGDFVGVVSSVRPQDRRDSEKGVEYYDSEFEALLAKVARLPSKLGNKSLLDDLMKSLPGNVIEPVSRRRCVAGNA